MPFFNYSCECGSSGERLVVVNDDRTCPECGREIKLEDRVQCPFENVVIRVTPTYFDGPLGEFVTGPAHKKALLKERDLVEVGDFNYLDEIPRGKPLEKPVLTDEEFREAWVNEVVEKKSSDAPSAEESW